MSYKMAQALVAEARAGGEVLELGMAESIVRSQRECVLCGHGIIVRAWGEVVPSAERLVLEGRGPDGLARSVAIHAGCLPEVSAGRAISDALGFTEPEV